MAARAMPVGVVAATPLFREGVCAMIHRAPDLRLETVLGPGKARDLLPSGRNAPTVVIEGLHAPLEELDLLGECLYHRQPGRWVVIFSHSYFPTAAWAWKKGVRGLLHAVTTEANLLEAIQRVANDHYYKDPVFDQIPVAAISELADGSIWEQFSPTQRKVLQYAAYTPLSNAEIADRLNVGKNTIKTHLTDIRRLLPEGPTQPRLGTDVEARATELRERTERMLVGPTVLRG